MFISSYTKKSEVGNYRAEIHQTNEGYSVNYFLPTGEQIRSDNFIGKPLTEAASAANTWINSIENLNG